MTNSKSHSIRVGRYEVSLINFGMFKLDGGSMFGSVPKNLWAKAIAPDEENCIPLATRCLLLEGDGRKILVDVGMGEKWNDKFRKMYGVQNLPEGDWGFLRESITDVILTHLHFDHAGGISRFAEGGALIPSFPNAVVHLQSANWEHAQKPSLKDRASYLAENVTPLKDLPLKLYSGSAEILPGIWGHRVDGHTKGQQWIEVRSEELTLMYSTDLIPTSHHLPLPYHMGYDLCADTLLQEKETFLKKALSEKHVVVFEHDPKVAAVHVGVNEKGHYSIKELFTAWAQ